MPDREKVIKGLELLKDFLGDGLPGKRVVFNSYINIVNNALVLLKEQPKLIRCKDCRNNHQCGIQFKFADPDNEGDWYCAYGAQK